MPKMYQNTMKKKLYLIQNYKKSKYIPKCFVKCKITVNKHIFVDFGLKIIKKAFYKFFFQYFLIFNSAQEAYVNLKWMKILPIPISSLVRKKTTIGM